MSNDPGLLTDATGEGMAGAMDVSLETVHNMPTVYNGSTSCKGCGMMLNPVQSLHMELCPSCNRREKVNLVKGRMA